MGNYSVHSIYKQPTGARLAVGALATVYNATGAQVMRREEAAGSEPASDAVTDAPDSGPAANGTVGFSIYQVPGSDGLWAPAYVSGDVTVKAPQYRVGNVTEGSDAEAPPRGPGGQGPGAMGCRAKGQSGGKQGG